MYIPYKDRKEFAALVGMTLKQVVVDEKEDQITFIADNGQTFMLYHDQDCCESVSINDIEGDIQDLIGLPIVTAEEAFSDDAPLNEYTESHTWTFYRIATAKGMVVIRWYGESNGNYSESASFSEIK